MIYDAAIAKEKTIGIQYDVIMKKIADHLESENCDSKVIIPSPPVLLDDTIELLLLAGFDVIIVTKNGSDKEEHVLYEISWENAEEDKKGKKIYTSSNDTFGKLIDLLGGMPPHPFCNMEQEDECDSDSDLYDMFDCPDDLY